MLGLQVISSQMSANLLTFNTSKTEFNLIGLEQQLARITLAYMTQYALLVILASIFMNILFCSDQISAHRRTRSSDLVTLARQPFYSSFKVNNRSFRHVANDESLSLLTFFFQIWRQLTYFKIIPSSKPVSNFL